MTKIALVSATFVSTLAVCVIAAAPAVRKPPLRAVEPRLSGDWQWRPCSEKRGSGDRLIADITCGAPNLSAPPVSMVPAEDCDDVTQTQSEAVAALAAAPQCIDAAVATLAKLARARPQPSVLSDLAAAYLVRARRKNQPSDLVRALDAADEAVKRAPRGEVPRFNQALALEALGFEDDAISAWDDLRRTDPQSWGHEAAGHWTRLLRARTRRAATRWPLNSERIPDAVRRGDRAAVGQLVAPYRQAALRYLEENVLPAWARATTAHDSVEAKRQFAVADFVATELARLAHDRFPLDVVDQMRSADAARRRVLAKGFLAYASAKELQNDLAHAADAYREAETTLGQAGSPLKAEATIGRATATLFVPAESQRGFALLAAVEREASRNRYRYLLARVHTTRGLLLLRQSRYLDSLAEYDAAEAIYARVNDQESLGNVHARKLGILRIVGQKDLVWREALQALRYAPHIVEVRQRHVLLGEVAVSAVALGYPEVALRYQNAAVRAITDQLATAGDGPHALEALRVDLGIALRERAAIRGRMGYPGAKEDLAEAKRLMAGMPLDKNSRKAERARLLEVEAQLLLHANPKLAIRSFSDAYALAPPTYYRTFSASLLVGRAEAHLLSGERAAAEADLKAAIAELRGEERGMLAERERGQGELLWSPYFSRSRDAYTRLIRQLVEEGDSRQAFDYAEQARAFEVLNLVLELDDVPSSFRTWTKGSEPLELQQIKDALPPATFLVEYCVLGDRTYAWIVGRADFERFSLAAGDEQIAAWSAELQRSGTRRREVAFNATLAAVSAALIHEPLARIAEIARARRIHPRVVFVPDASMHGLPFAALRDPADSRRALIELYPISAEPSATLYTFSLERDAKLASLSKPSVLLVGDPTFNRRLDVAAGLPRLQRALTEVRAIGRIYRNAAHIVRLLRDRATVPGFLKLARGSTIVHFAGHAVVNPDAPSRSLLLFAPSPGHSGALDAQELLRKLHSFGTRLVVLSACSTAGGVPVGAEGLAPLVRPIIAAGVPAAVGSLWTVRDDETEELFTHFHAYYRSGLDADVALQRAQLDMLHHRKQLFHSPAVWASFQVIGYASSPFSKGGARRRK